MCEKFPSDACRKQLAKVTTPRKQVSPPPEQSDISPESDVESSSDEVFDDPKATMRTHAVLKRSQNCFWPQ